MNKSFLPSLAAARVADPGLPAGEPAQSVLAAVTLAMHMQRRDVRLQRMEIAASRLANMPGSPPPPASPFVARTHAALARVVEHRRCTICGVRPGQVPCPFCNLAGCGECGGAGWIACATCGGVREIAIADVHILEDRVVDFRLTFTPTLPSYAHEEWLRQSIDDTVDGPDVFLFDVERSAAFAPYREIEREEDDSFHGHRFEDALTRARHAIERLRGGEVFTERLRAWARPLLVLSWQDATATVLADGLGGVRVFRPRA